MLFLTFPKQNIALEIYFKNRKFEGMFLVCNHDYRRFTVNYSCQFKTSSLKVIFNLYTVIFTSSFIYLTNRIVLWLLTNSLMLFLCSQTLFPSFLTPGNCWSVLCPYGLAFSECHINGIMQFVGSLVRLLSLSIMHLRCTHVVECIYS